ncbi:VWA domain-containing protein [Poseidonocella sp. HB161398]|uniref:cobaltochelatase CobT-related protein n=1 Tax=Poseidonocella sp. HB161398 TaxID=2320855 RepID=UPI001109028E|nr:VWA domain-containing protein [Poseidonocella sp. HB161398]
MRSELFQHEMAQTSAVFGRESGVRVVFRGESAGTDGKVVFLPALPAGREVSVDTAKYMRGFVDHEAGHLRHSDMPLIMEKYQQYGRERRPFAKMMHNALEDVWLERRVIREYPGAEANLHATADMLAQKLKRNLKSDPETRARLAKPEVILPLACTWVGRLGYGGDGNAELVAGLDPSLRKMCDELVAEVLKARNSADVFRISERVERELMKELADKAMEEMMPEPEPEPESGEGEPEPGDGDAAGDGASAKPEPEGEGEKSDGAAGSDGEDGGGEAPEVEREHDGERGVEGLPGEDEDADGEDDGDGEGGEDEASSGHEETGEDGDGGGFEDDGEMREAKEGAGERAGAVGEPGDKELEASEPGGTDEAGAGSRAELDLDALREAAETAARKAMEGVAELPEIGDALKDKLSEEGITRRRGEDCYVPYSTEGDAWFRENGPHDPLYRPASLAIRDRLGRHDRVSVYQAILEGMSGSVNVLRRTLERCLASLERRDWDFGRTHGRLDSRRLVAAVAGRETVFKQRADRVEPNTVVSIVIDLSGSMSGSRALMAQKCAIALAEALERTSVRYEIIGFSQPFADHSERSDAPRWAARVEALAAIEFKAVEEPLWRAKHRLASLDLVVGGNNCDGESLMMVHARLRKRSERRKVMLVLSDGSPCCVSPAGSEVLERHLRDTLAFIESEGVETAAIGMQTTAVEDYYRKFAVVHLIEDLSGEARPCCTNRGLSAVPLSPDGLILRPQ